MLSHVATDERVHGLRLCWSGRLASTDCPYWLVGNHCAHERFGAQGVQYGVQLLSAHRFSLASFVFGFGFTDAQYWDQTGSFQYAKFLRNERIAFFVISTTLGVTDDDVLSTKLFQHVSRDVAGERARQVYVNVLATQSNGRALQRSLRFGQIHHWWRNRHATTVHTVQFGFQASNQLLYHGFVAVQLPVTHN